MIRLKRNFSIKKVILCVALIPSFVYAAQNNAVNILYFFSPSCPHCIEARPFIMDLSKKYNIEGLQFGEGNPPSFPFPVKKGDKATQGKYEVKGVPTLAIFVDGVYRQKIQGMPDIGDAQVLIRGLKSGALTITEAMQTMKESEEITITGWIIARGVNFQKAQFFITDRKTELPIKAWLPREVVKSPVPKKSPRLMSDVTKKAVVLKGNFRKSSAGNLFIVTKEVLPD